VKKAIVEVSKRVVALTPHERIDTAEAYFICPLDMVDTIITDDDSTPIAKTLHQETGVTVV